MSQQENIEAKYDRLSDEFFDTYYTYYPVHATRQGLHQYDTSLGHYRRAEIDETLRRMKAIQAQVAAIDPAQMDHLHALDHPVLTTRMKREIFWIEQWRFWENNPLFYKDIIMEGMFNLVSRNFAPAEERLAALIARQKDVPQVLQCARENLANPPVEYTNQAIDQVKGSRSFFEGLPSAFSEVKDQALLAAFAQTNAMVMDEMEKYLAFLQTDLLPRSHGNFAVGEAGIQAIIDAEEMIDVPVAKILERCYRDLSRTEAEIAELQQKIDPNSTVEELVKRMRADHPAPEDLHQAIRDELKQVRGYLTEYDLMTIPPEMPDVIATPMPDYASGGGMMLTPGPFETVAEESYLALQIPKPSWTQSRIDGLWSDFNTYALALLMIHECYPGHHTQFYLEKRVQLRASKDHDSDSNSDGWAEYGKYMMVDKVYAPKNLFYRLAVLLSKRSYIAAAIAGMEIHLQAKTLPEASDFLMEKQGRTRENTYIWVLNRATHYPTHLTYYIGSEMVRKLHDDYKALKGDAYSLKEFNDRFLTYGLIPIKVIRKDMLGDADDGVLF
ncbi:MAG TPA: DUF885 domain-containing protein [Anaerolineaceae bacterium]|nr:DUF885 domain-containing protein [Anaerolineaceae bacterium]